MVQFGPVWPGLARFGPVGLVVVLTAVVLTAVTNVVGPVGPVWFGLARFGSVWFGLAKFVPIWYGLA